MDKIELLPTDHVPSPEELIAKINEIIVALNESGD